MNAIDRMPIVADAGISWTALRCYSQREASSKEILARYGFNVFFPIEMKKVRVSRHAKRRTLRSFPMIPGYLFLPWEGEPPLYDLAKLRHVVLGVVAFGGRPARIDPDGMAHLIAISGQEIVRPQAPQIAFAAGDTVRFAPGSPLSGLQGRIGSVKKARAIIDMLGGGRSIDVPLATLELVA